MTKFMVVPDDKNFGYICDTFEEAVEKATEIMSPKPFKSGMVGWLEDLQCKPEALIVRIIEYIEYKVEFWVPGITKSCQ